MNFQTAATPNGSAHGARKNNGLRIRVIPLASRSFREKLRSTILSCCYSALASETPRVSAEHVNQEEQLYVSQSHYADRVYRQGAQDSRHI